MRFVVDISNRVPIFPTRLISVSCVRSCEEFDINLLEIVNTCFRLDDEVELELFITL